MDKRKLSVVLAFLSVTVVVVAFAIHHRHLERIRELEQLLKSDHYLTSPVRMNVSSFKRIIDVSKERFIELVKEKTTSSDGIVSVPFIFKDGSHFYLYEKYEPPFSVAYCYTVPWI